MSFYNCLRIGTQTVQRQSVRDYAFKSHLKIKWVRPEKISCIHPDKSGDCAKLPAVNPEQYIPGFEQSKELQTADPIVQSLFQLKNNRSRYTASLQRDCMVKGVHRHALDYGSMEAKLAKMTATIRTFQTHMEQFPRDRKIKVTLKELIDKRKKYLKFLRRWDYRRFEWMLEKLDLVYKPPPSEFHWITRKESLVKLTDQYCENIKEQRLEAYRLELENKKIPQCEQQLAKLQQTQREQQEQKLPLTVTDADIETLQKELAQLKLQHAQVEPAELERIRDNAAVV